VHSEESSKATSKGSNKKHKSELKELTISMETANNASIQASKTEWEEKKKYMDKEETRKAREESCRMYEFY
jgi:hypothetical protein